MSKLEDTDNELNAADLEDNNEGSLFSDIDEDSDHDINDRNEDGDPKEYRDIAEGKNLNNSFVGPYPECWDHLHIDKGPNP